MKRLAELKKVDESVENVDESVQQPDSVALTSHYPVEGALSRDEDVGEFRSLVLLVLLVPLVTTSNN